MQSFLNLVAKDLLSRFNGDLSNVTVVFPNLRARLFFNEHLIENSEKNLWSPQYLDIDTIFKIGSTLKIADPLLLNSILYQVFAKHFALNNPNSEIESFDEFFYFGEIILNDFNDIDKYLVNASLLYANISDLEQLNSDFDFLSDEQKTIINRFFTDIKINKTQLKENFYSIWKILSSVYADFKNKLKNKGLAYQGMLYRDSVENFEKNAIDHNGECYVFVGFNLLTKCEEKLFSFLKHKALFYWDFDNYYLKNEHFEAGTFLRQNLQKFPSALSFDADNFSKKSSVKIISSTSETAQASYIPQWFNQLGGINYQKPDTAIVFCNENILLPVLSFLPTESEKINVTMGFPINQTPVYDYVIRLLELYQKGINTNGFYYIYVQSVLNHHYSLLIDKELYILDEKIKAEKLFYPTIAELNCKTLFTKIETPTQLIDYLINIVKITGAELKNEDNNFTDENLFNEAVFRVYQILNRLSDLIKEGYLDVKLNTFILLIKRVLAYETVPFHGEPARGLQLMGMLETRNLDFKNLILLSVNEGVIPKTSFDSSFIPQFIRKHFNMSRIEHQDAIYAYYFYRLLQRTENVTLLYNTAKNQTYKAEMSRFLLQMLVEAPFEVKRETLNTDIQVISNKAILIPKTAELLEKIHSSFDANQNGKTITPTAINSLIDCSLRFYFQYIAKFKKEDEFSDELDDGLLGRIIHCSIELIYMQICNNQQDNFKSFTVYPEQIDFCLKNNILISNIIEKAFEKEFFNRHVSKANYNGEQLIYFGVVRKFIIKLLKYDRQKAPFQVYEMEQSYSIAFDLGNGVKVNIGGRIDRVTIKDNHIYIEDFKTSNRREEANSLQSLFEQHTKRAKYITQAFWYSFVIEKEFVDKTIVPLLLYIPILSADEPNYIILDKKEVIDFSVYSSDFEENIKQKISEIFNPNIPFSATTVLDNCTYCDFKSICGK
ncbi:MAG: PD-(D/E)XK nuclease family protein [Prevotellaceae bacterium]|jgi:hypothetical protein|nr:PD-(D/E)XK nuclease family protein [Prevotellaceae bacterium]